MIRLAKRATPLSIWLRAERARRLADRRPGSAKRQQRAEIALRWACAMLGTDLEPAELPGIGGGR